MNVDPEPVRQRDCAATAMAALANRWRKRLATLRRQPTCPVGLAALDTLTAEHEDRQRLRHERAQLKPVAEDGVLVRPASGTGWAMRGQRERWSHRNRTDWPGESR